MTLAQTLTAVQIPAKRYGVRPGTELNRIAELPRRVWNEADTSEAVALLSDHLTTMKGPRLFPLQAIALAETADQGGGYFPLPVGQGKTLITFLLPTLLESKRPLLIVPSSLVKKTERELAKAKENGWRLDVRFRIVGTSKFGIESGKNIFVDGRFDLVMIDECHQWETQSTSRVKRLRRFIKSEDGQKCTFVFLTGTPKSVKTTGPLVKAALGKQNSPYPTQKSVLDDWHRALDHKVRRESRLLPGALATEAKNEGDRNARAWFSRRIAETKGCVVGAGEINVKTPLRLSRLDIKPPTALAGLIKKAEKGWETPNGTLLTEAVQVWALVRQLSLGFVMRWKEPGPDEWMSARREWQARVRETLKRDNILHDSPLQVRQRAIKEEWREWFAWAEVKDQFKPVSVAEWHDDTAIVACAKWLNRGLGIAWTESIPFGQRLAAYAGVPYRGAGDNAIDDDEQSIVASIQAHSTGRNLQFHFSRNLITSPPSGWNAWEQCLGRTHRQGQPAEGVTCGVVWTGSASRSSWDNAMAGALADQDLTGQERRLCIAELNGLPHAAGAKEKEKENGTGFRNREKQRTGQRELFEPA